MVARTGAVVEIRRLVREWISYSLRTEHVTTHCKVHLIGGDSLMQKNTPPTVEDRTTKVLSSRVRGCFAKSKWIKPFAVQRIKAE